MKKKIWSQKTKLVRKKLSRVGERKKKVVRQVRGEKASSKENCRKKNSPGQREKKMFDEEEEKSEPKKKLGAQKKTLRVEEKKMFRRG